MGEPSFKEISLRTGLGGDKEAYLPIVDQDGVVKACTQRTYPLPIALQMAWAFPLPTYAGAGGALLALTELLELGEGDKAGTLILIDEVLLYARERIGRDLARLNSLINFFQYLTQAATKVKGCAIVASLLSSEVTHEDTLGRQIKGQLYDIFQRQREEAVEPVVKEDVAEVLRRRFFKPESLRDPASFKQHVVAALKGIAAVDDQTAKQGAETEERFLKSYPFHPDLTEMLYSKWTQLDGFQRTRGALRTFALALREAEGWDTSPLVGPAVLLPPPGKAGLSESLREMVAVADTAESEGRRQVWTGILDGEFSRARQIQTESVGLKHREVEQAVVATFLHSQPLGQSGKTRDLIVLLGSARPDKIELEKGLARWAQTSYWLDDQYTGTAEGQLPLTWRLGNRPNLTQMHAVAARNIPDETVRARLLDEIGKTKPLTANASAAGVRVHTLPARPRDIEDEGAFHYAVLGLSAASESGSPSAEAKRFLDEKTGADNPRVYRNALLLLAPSRDGLELAIARVRDYLAWEVVRGDIAKQQKNGNVDPARAQTLSMNVDKAKGRIAEAIRQAYCIVVTVSEKDEAQAFKIAVTEEAHHILLRKKQEVTGEETVTDVLLREIRELGESVICLDQHPSFISKPALGNTYTTFAFNLKHRGDIAMIQDCLHLDGEQAGYLGRLEVGWAVVKLQGRWFFPFLVKLPLLWLRKGSVTDEILRRRSGATGAEEVVAAGHEQSDSLPISRREGNSTPVASRHSDLLAIPGKGKREESGEEDGCAIRLTTQERRFLMDVWIRPTSTIMGRYSSLGLSPRRGTGLQKNLLRRGLLPSCPIQVRHSRTKALSLTELGKRTLGISEPEAERLGGPEHRYWKKRLAQQLAAQGYTVVEECPVGGGKTIDLLATKDGQRLAVEVETGKSDATANVQKCLDAGVDQVLVVTTSPAVRIARALPSSGGKVFCLSGAEALALLAAGTEVVPASAKGWEEEHRGNSRRSSSPQPLSLGKMPPLT